MRTFCAALTLSLLLLATTAARAQDSGAALPKLISHADAVYPAIARTAHVMGDVVVKITTDGESVVDAKAESGPPLLLKAAEENAKTWKFAPHPPGTFHVTYRFKFMDSDLAASFPNSGSIVELAAAPAAVSIYYASMGMGTWKAALHSSHGRLFLKWRVSSTGPHGEWLDVDDPGAQDAKEADDDEDDYGHKEGEFLVFSKKLAEPDGKRLETYFVGKWSATRIVGTFVDESGVRGTWTATRIPDPETK
jgi:Gram-negative bacterial TonB protein C-terminal